MKRLEEDARAEWDETARDELLKWQEPGGLNYYYLFYGTGIIGASLASGKTTISRVSVSNEMHSEKPNPLETI